MGLDKILRGIALAGTVFVGSAYLSGCVDPPVQQEQVQQQPKAQAQPAAESKQIGEPKIDQDYFVRTGLEKIIGKAITKQGTLTRIDNLNIPYMWKNDTQINGVRQIEILCFQTIGGTKLKLAYLWPESFDRVNVRITYFPIKGNELTHSNIISGGFDPNNNHWLPAIQTYGKIPYEPKIHVNGVIGNYENIQYVR